MEGKAAARKSIAPICEAELAVRICEAAMGVKRPDGSAEHALSTMSDEDRHAWLKAARSAMSYWKECIDRMRMVS